MCRLQHVRLLGRGDKRMIIFPLTTEVECTNQIVARDHTGDMMFGFTSTEEEINPREVARFEGIVRILNEAKQPPTSGGTAPKGG